MKKKTWLQLGCGCLGAAALIGGTLLIQGNSSNPAQKAVESVHVGNIPKTSSYTKVSTAVDKQEVQGMTVHFMWDSEQGEFPHLYYENVNGNQTTNMTSPGVPMHDDGDGWYSYTIPDAESAQVKISVPQLGYETTLQEKKGDEWWYAAGGWYEEDPTPADSQNTDTKVQTEVKEQEVVEDMTDVAADSTITVHCFCDSDTPSIYYWNALPEDLETAWPGTEMEEEGNGWYRMTFKKTSKINVLFVMSGRQTEDLTAKTGEWWYAGGEWSDKKPDLGDIIPTPDPGKEEDKPNPTDTKSTPKPASTMDPSVNKGTTDFREETIYFLMTSRFYDGDSSNNVHCEHDKDAGNGDDDPAWRGDFKGLIEKLDYIKALGFSAIWITPVVENASAYDYHGYHALNFKKVDPRLETEGASYQELIKACHDRDMKVIQDVVFNHTSQYGEQGLCELFDQEYVLDKGAAGNSTKFVRTDNGKLDEAMTKASVETHNNPSSDYDNVTGNNPPYAQYIARVKAIKDGAIYRSGEYCGRVNYETFEATTCQIADDCQELNTENPSVYNYLVDAYSQYISWGVDAFRIDTMKHVSRLTFNEAIVPGLQAAAKKYQDNDNFYMFGEVCTRKAEIFNSGNARVSPFYYTWKEEKPYAWNSSSSDGADNLKMCEQAYNDSRAHDSDYREGEYGISDNAFLKGNEYHEPDYTQNSGMGVIDYAMHINFTTAKGAYNVALGEDKYFNDSTYNVVYVDSHDYGPNVDGRDDSGHDKWRYGAGTEAWAENMDLMFTFRGIPCLYYGSEIEFMKDAKIDDYNNALKTSGRAYFGDHIEGSVKTTDFGVYSDATGEMATTLNSTLAKHLSKLNRIRRAVPALQKGQYSTEGCSGNMAYKRRYTNKAAGVDSYALVAISGGCTFTGVLDGTYVDLVTGDIKKVSGGTLTTDSLGKANMRVYVLQNDTAEKYGANGKIGDTLTYLK